MCPLCGAANQCAPASTGRFSVPCWCAEVSIDPQTLASLPEDMRGKACLCPACAGVVPAAGKV